MTQFVFIHQDVNGNVWKHIHFSYIKAMQARDAWAKMTQVVVAISNKIRELPRDVPTPRIVGRNVNAIIELEE